MPVPFLDLKAQYTSVKAEIDAAIEHVITTCTFASGPSVDAFENAYAEYCGTKHCVGLGSGTAALELLLRAYGIGAGDEVITQANSFFATGEAISLVGATPVLIDCNESDALTDVTKLHHVITAKTKAIIPVHLYGQPTDIDPILAIAKDKDLIVIEDACQAHGSRYKGKMAGSLAHAAAFSFYPGKNLGAFGEAGAITTNNADIAEKVKMLRDHGMREKYRHEVVGRNDRMDGIQGGVLSAKLKHLDEWNKRRRAHADRYRSLLSKINGIKLFEAHPDRESNNHLFVIRVQNRDVVQKRLKEKGVTTGIHYPVPIHLQPAYADLGWKKGDFPMSEMLSDEVLSLPMYAEMTDAQIEEVCTGVKACIQ